MPQPEHLAGTSFAPQLHDPTAAGKDAVFMRWQNAESIRTDRYLYTEWLGDDGAVLARMLYDHETDPAENVNIAEQPEHADLVTSLSAQLHEHIWGR